jgi:hypothetical protein
MVAKLQPVGADRKGTGPAGDDGILPGYVAAHAANAVDARSIVKAKAKGRHQGTGGEPGAARPHRGKANNIGRRCADHGCYERCMHQIAEKGGCAVGAIILLGKGVAWRANAGASGNDARRLTKAGDDTISCL